MDSDFPPLPGSKPPSVPSPSLGPVNSPSFADPSLQTSLEIFSDKTPHSPLVLPLDSIRFQNVTIRRKNKKAPPSTSDSSPIPLHYTPLSSRLKNVARNLQPSSPRALRAKTPLSSSS